MFFFQDELVSVSEKAVLRVSDLLDWITNPSDIEWDRGILGVCHDDCVNSSNSKGLSAKKDKSTTNGGNGSNPKELSQSTTKDENNLDEKKSNKKGPLTELCDQNDTKDGGAKVTMLPGGVRPQHDNNLSAKFSPGYHEFLADIMKEKENIGEFLFQLFSILFISLQLLYSSILIKQLRLIGDIKGIDDLAVIILSHSQYSRYRSVLKRIAGCEKEWMNSSLIVALGGFTTPTRKTYVLFCRDNFDYAELEEHPHLCNHLGKHFSIISEQIIFIILFSYVLSCDYTNQYFLAPKLKGRPRKRKPRQTTGVGSPAESEASSESSTSTSMSISAPKVKHFVLEGTSFQLDMISIIF